MRPYRWHLLTAAYLLFLPAAYLIVVHEWFWLTPVAGVGSGLAAGAAVLFWREMKGL